HLLLSFILMIRLPPLSTLFPYTTLFRSSIVIVLAGSIGGCTLPVSQYPEITPPTVEVSASYPGANAQVVADTVAAPIEQQVNGVDRKSTRLNSSHVAISYAVFCLKKKKT